MMSKIKKINVMNCQCDELLFYPYSDSVINCMCNKLQQSLKVIVTETVEMINYY